MAYSRKGILKKTNKYNSLAKNHEDYLPIYLWGEKYCMAEIREIFHIGRDTVANRVRRNGETFDEASAKVLINKYGGYCLGN